MNFVFFEIANWSQVYVKLKKGIERELNSQIKISYHQDVNQ